MKSFDILVCNYINEAVYIYRSELWVFTNLQSCAKNLENEISPYKSTAAAAVISVNLI